ncbi:MAG: SapC family protein [Rhizobiales bacterium]|nr:SapC family protein [Hyphomicrobiales bacterium]
MTTAASKPAAFRFVPVKEAGLSGWSRLEAFPWLDQVGVLPLADTEFMALSHFCPLAIEMHEQGPRPVAIVHARFVCHRLLSEDFRWRPPYAPLALRSLPFWNGAAMAAEAIEICPDLAQATADPKSRQAMFGQKGKPTQSYAAITSMLDRIARSHGKLRNAAKVLLAADLLAPLADLGGGALQALHTIDPEAMSALSPGRLMGLTADSCCPLELATAITFSRRWLAKDALRSADGQFPTMAGARQRAQEHAVVEPLDQLFGLDDSPLFSFDDFLRNHAGAP